MRTTEKHCNTNGFSRLPISTPSASDDTTNVCSIFNVNQIYILPVGSPQLQQATSKDPVLGKIMVHLKKGWPNKIDDELQPYYRRRHELTIKVGSLFWGMRVVVPKSYQKTILAELHTSHPGIVSIAHTHVWWPSIDKHIEQVVHDCSSCQSEGSDTNRNPIQIAWNPSMESGILVWNLKSLTKWNLCNLN